MRYVSKEYIVLCHVLSDRHFHTGYLCHVFGFMNYTYDIILVMNKLSVNMVFKIPIILLIYLQKQLNVALLEPVEDLIDAAGDHTWPAIKNLLQRETATAISGLSSSLSGFDLDPKTLDKMLASYQTMQEM